MQFQTAYIRGRLEEQGQEEWGVDVVPWWLCFTHVAYEGWYPSELFTLTEGRYLGWGNLDLTLLTDSRPGNVLTIPWSSQIHIDRTISEEQDAYNGAAFYKGLGPHAQAILVRRASVVITGGEDLGNGYHLVPETWAEQSESAVFLRIHADPETWADNDYVSKVAFDANDVPFAINTEATDKTVLVLGLDCVILKPGESVVYTLGVPEGDIRNASAGIVGEDGRRSINVRFHFDGTDIKWQVGEGPLFCSPQRLKGRLIP